MIVDEQMTADELEADIQRELEQYHIYKPERVTITMERIRTLSRKRQAEMAQKIEQWT